MALKVNSPIVSVDWLYQNLENENLIILDGTIPKVTVKSDVHLKDEQIKGTRFFDIKKVFSDQNATYPNTILSEEDFQKRAQALGINNDSCIVVYDKHGLYSAPRVWWLFKTFGFDNIAVLNGGLPGWKKQGYEVVKFDGNKYEKGDFIADFKSNKVCYTNDVLEFMKDKSVCHVDARGASRFYPTEPEPRPEVRSGHIPNSKNLPYTTLQENGTMKDVKDLEKMFSTINPEEKSFVFSCGSGVTACILALGLELTGKSEYMIYDGSWSEWGRRVELPIETQ